MFLTRTIRAIAAAVSRPARPHQPPPQREVLLDPAGFAVLDNATRVFQVEWSRVREVFAYKDDLFSHDEICLGFRCADDGSYWWVSEEDSGYSELLSELEQRFPGIRTDWFREVAFPAFVPNRTTLWGETWELTEEQC